MKGFRPRKEKLRGNRQPSDPRLKRLDELTKQRESLNSELNTLLDKFVEDRENRALGNKISRIRKGIRSISTEMYNTRREIEGG